MCNEASQLRLPRALQYTHYCTRTFCAANASTETRTSYLLPRTSCRSTSSSTATRCSTRWHRLPSSGGRATRSRSRSRWRWRRRSSSIRPTRRCSAEPQPTGGLYFGVLLYTPFHLVVSLVPVPRSISFSTRNHLSIDLRAPRWRRNFGSVAQWVEGGGSRLSHRDADCGAAQAANQCRKPQGELRASASRPLVQRLHDSPDILMRDPRPPARKEAH